MKKTNVKKSPVSIELNRQSAKSEISKFRIRYRGKELVIPVKYMNSTRNTINYASREVYDKQGLTNMFGEKLKLKFTEIEGKFKLKP